MTSFKFLACTVLAIATFSGSAKAADETISPPLVCSGQENVQNTCHVLLEGTPVTISSLGLVTATLISDRRCPLGRFCFVSGPVTFKLTSEDEMGEQTALAVLGFGEGTMQKFTPMSQEYTIELIEVSPNIVDVSGISSPLQYKIIVSGGTAPAPAPALFCSYKHKESTLGGRKGEITYQDAFGNQNACNKDDNWKTSCKDKDGRTDEVACQDPNDVSNNGICQYKHKEDTQGGKKGEVNLSDAFGQSKACSKNADWKTSCKDGNGKTDETGCK